MLADSVRKDRKIIKCILKVVITLGKQIIPFRGHGDDSKLYSGPGNTGNFQMMLDLCVESGD